MEMMGNCTFSMSVMTGDVENHRLSGRKGPQGSLDPTSLSNKKLSIVTDDIVSGHEMTL